MWSCRFNKRGNNSVSRDIRRVTTAGYPFRDHNESLTARVTLCSPTDAATFDPILDNSISGSGEMIFKAISTKSSKYLPAIYIPSN